MRTDSIFYELFLKAPRLLFEVLGEPSELSESYDFCSVEVKQTAFRIDGVFVPKLDALDQRVIFIEVQFQSDPTLYDRMNAEIAMYLRQNPEVIDWRAVAIFSRRGMEPKNQYRLRHFLQADQFQALYLNDFLEVESNLLGIQLMQLIASKPQETNRYLQAIAKQVKGKTDLENQGIIELISTVMVYKFPELSREEIESMFTVSELKQTKVYQEAQLEEAQSLIFRLLNRRVGAIAPETEAQIRQLSLSKIEQLGEALLDFSDCTDLDTWLEQNQ